MSTDARLALHTCAQDFLLFFHKIHRLFCFPFFFHFFLKTFSSTFFKTFSSHRTLFNNLSKTSWSAFHISDIPLPIFLLLFFSLRSEESSVIRYAPALLYVEFCLTRYYVGDKLRAIQEDLERVACAVVNPRSMTDCQTTPFS